jgi:hypothetical protein
MKERRSWTGPDRWNCRHTISKFEKKINGEIRAIAKNFEIAKKVRETIKESGGVMPEDLPLVEHIAEVRKRITGKRTKALSRPKA